MLIMLVPFLALVQLREAACALDHCLDQLMNQQHNPQIKLTSYFNHIFTKTKITQAWELFFVPV